LLGFAALALLASLGFIPPPVQKIAQEITSGLLAMAVAGLGMKTSLKILASTKPMLALAMILQSFFILAICVVGVKFAL
jgi:uncharacterized membrane protein YadS